MSFTEMAPLAALMHQLGALLVLAVGIAGFVRPDLLAKRLEITAGGPSGLSELRAALGGVMAALALFCLWAQEPLVFAALGVAFLGAAAARVFDLAAGRRARGIWVGLGVDLLLAVLLLFPG